MRDKRAPKDVCGEAIVITNRHSIVIATERSVITLVVNMSTCKYNWKGLNESALYFEAIQ